MIHGARRTPFDARQDDLIRRIYHETPTLSWRRRALIFVDACGVCKTSKQLRERFVEHLDSRQNYGKFRVDETRRVVQLYRTFGPKWSFIASCLQGRTAGRVRNEMTRHLPRFKHGRPHADAVADPATLFSFPPQREQRRDTLLRFEVADIDAFRHLGHKTAARCDDAEGETHAHAGSVPFEPPPPDLDARVTTFITDADILKNLVDYSDATECHPSEFPELLHFSDFFDLSDVCTCSTTHNIPTHRGTSAFQKSKLTATTRRGDPGTKDRADSPPVARSQDRGGHEDTPCAGFPASFARVRVKLGTVAVTKTEHVACRYRRTTSNALAYTFPT